MNNQAIGYTQLKINRRKSRSASIFERNLVRRAAKRAVVMLKPWVMARNPVLFITEIGAVLTLVVLVVDLFHNQRAFFYNLAVTLILFLTVLFANFAEALAEARGKA